MDKLQEIYNRLINKFSWRGIIAMIVITSSIGYLFMLFYKIIPTENKDIVTLMLGYVIAKYGSVIDWYFGASKSQSDQAKIEQAKQLSAQETTTTTSVIPNPVTSYELIAPSEGMKQFITDEEFNKLTKEEQGLYKKKV